MSESDESIRVPPLNLTRTELNLMRALLTSEAYDTYEWPEQDVTALYSLEDKLDTLYYTVERNADDNGDTDDE